MSFDWSDYLGLAQELFTYRASSYTEARLRTVISRAYYATFVKARNYLRYKEGVRIPSRQNPHLFVIVYFRNKPDKVRQRIADNLDLMRRYRNEADYDNNISSLFGKTTETLNYARNVISTLDNL